MLLKPDTVNPADPNALQQILDHAANVQIYIDKNPKNALAVGIVVAGLSGPKGIIQFAVEQAFAQTDIGQSINNYLDSLNEAAGRLIAEKIEGYDLDPETYESDQKLINGGGLISSILTGSVSGKGGKTVIGVNSTGGHKPGAVGGNGQASGAKATGSGAKFADQAKLDDHFVRHGSDFGAKNKLEYQAQADKFLTAPKPAGVLEKARPNGDIVRYNPGTDEFGVVSSGGSIRTYYKPDPAMHGKG